MSRTKWTTETWNGSAWVAESSGIYAPNENFSRDIMSTQSKVQLANGSNAFFTPETKYVQETITWQWLRLDYTDAFLAQITGYMQNGTYLRITDHRSNQYTGKFISLKRVWLSGISDDWQDVEGVFETQ